MSDEKKLDLAREIYPDSKRARKESFTPTQWAGVERAWEWIVDAYVARIKRHPPFQNLTDAGEEYMRGLAEQAASDFFKHAKTASPNDTTVFVVDQPKEPTVKQEPTIYGAPIIEDAHMPSGYGLVGVNMSAFEKPTPPWTEAQREAADELVGIIARKMKRLDPATVHTEAHAEVCAAIAKVAPMFVDQNTAERMSRDAATREERFSEHGRQPTQADQGIPRPLDGGDRAHERGQGEGRGVGRVGCQASRDAEPRWSMGIDRGDGLADGHHGARPLNRAADDLLSGNRGGEAQPAPSPAPAGVPDLDECLRTYWLAHSAHESADDPKREAVSAVRDLFVRTRDERIAEQAATIATLTKERDEARADSARTNGLREQLDAARVLVSDNAAERDAALARVAELEKRGAVDVEAWTRSLADMAQDDWKRQIPDAPEHFYSRLWHSARRAALHHEPLLRKHSRDVRRITREELTKGIDAYYEARTGSRLASAPHDAALRLREDLEACLRAALRAIGFEVEA